jgi:hypothetical protein
MQGSPYARSVRLCIHRKVGYRIHPWVLVSTLMLTRAVNCRSRCSRDDKGKAMLPGVSVGWWRGQQVPIRLRSGQALHFGRDDKSYLGGGASAQEKLSSRAKSGHYLNWTSLVVKVVFCANGDFEIPVATLLDASPPICWSVYRSRRCPLAYGSRGRQNMTSSTR